MLINSFINQVYIKTEIIISTDAITFTSLGTTLFAANENVTKIYTSDEGSLSKYIVVTSTNAGLIKSYYSTNLTTYTLFDSTMYYANPPSVYSYYNNY